MRILAVVLLLIMGWAVYYFSDAPIKNGSSRRQASVLMKAGGECVAIAEEATAHINPKLEFQRLELKGRKANVIMRCMADRHFYQSVVWLKYAEPVAKKIALDTNVSYDEALENLKRADMLIFEPQQNKPIFWQYQNASATGR